MFFGPHLCFIFTFVAIKGALGKGVLLCYPITLARFDASTFCKACVLFADDFASFLFARGAKIDDVSHGGNLPRRAAGFKLLGADHVFWLHYTIKSFAVYEAEFDSLFSQSCAIFVGGFGDLGRVVVADFRSQCRYQHQAFPH